MDITDKSINHAGLHHFEIGHLTDNTWTLPGHLQNILPIFSNHGII